LSFLPLSSKINRTVSIDGEAYLLFSGTSYLGMGSLEEYEQLVIEGIKKYGFNHGWSRINNIQLSIYEEFETYFSQQAGAKKALVLSSGFLAGKAALSALQKKADYTFIAPGSHPAILPDQVEVPMCAFQDWIRQISHQTEELPESKILFIANAVNALFPEIHDFQWINQLSNKHQYFLLIDDSHAFGTVGSGIFGTFSQWQGINAEVVVSGSLNKGLGIPAGIILGNTEILTSIIEQPIFRASSPPPPGNLYAFLLGQKLYATQYRKLNHLQQHFKKNGLIDPQNFNFVDQLPIYEFKNKYWTDLFAENKILVSSFPYPNPNDVPIHRIVISAHHEESDLEQLIGVLSK
jgi:8-amino-7-oxononanoate synthase